MKRDLRVRDLRFDFPTDRPDQRWERDLILAWPPCQREEETAYDLQMKTS